MFRDRITETPFTSRGADTYFREKVSGMKEFQSDVTFISTLRALLKDRIGDSKLNLGMSTCTYGKSQVDGVEPRKLMRAIYRPEDLMDNSLIIVNLANTSDGVDAIFKFICDKFTSINQNFTRINKATEFYQANFQVACFVNTDSKQSVVFVSNITYQKLHYLQCGILVFLPWFFKKEDGVTRDEMALIESLRMKTPDKYLECLRKMASGIDFRSSIIKEGLAGFEIRADKVRAQALQNDILNKDEEIRNLMARISDVIRSKEEKQTMLLGVETKIAEYNDEDSEIMDYFLRNKKLFFVESRNSTLTFIAKDYVMFFDEDMARSYISNDRSYVYTSRESDDPISKQDMKKLMTAIFIDQTLKMKMCAAYRFDLNGDVEGLRDFPYDGDFMDSTPNPHTDRYSCMGNYSRNVIEYLLRHDYIGALEQCVASCKSLNFGDSTVMCEFMRRLYKSSSANRNMRCIELPDGTVVDPVGAVRYLRSKEKENVEESNE